MVDRCAKGLQEKRQEWIPPSEHRDHLKALVSHLPGVLIVV